MSWNHAGRSIRVAAFLAVLLPAVMAPCIASPRLRDDKCSVTIDSIEFPVAGKMTIAATGTGSGLPDGAHCTLSITAEYYIKGPDLQADGVGMQSFALAVAGGKIIGGQVSGNFIIDQKFLNKAKNKTAFVVVVARLQCTTCDGTAAATVCSASALKQQNMPSEE